MVFDILLLCIDMQEFEIFRSGKPEVQPLRKVISQNLMNRVPNSDETVPKFNIERQGLLSSNNALKIIPISQSLLFSLCKMDTPSTPFQHLSNSIFRNPGRRGT